jgi:hypothetical protein
LPEQLKVSVWWVLEHESTGGYMIEVLRIKAEVLRGRYLNLPMFIF